MKCFAHPESDAVGSCKHCYKGVCSACAKDTGVGLVCSPECETEVKSLRAMVERNKSVYPLAAKTHTRNAVLLALFALVFLIFGIFEQRGTFLSSFLLAFAVAIAIGAIFSFANGRRYAKLSRT